MISHELKIVFVHVPKAAGQSVEDFLLHKLGESRKTRAKFLLRYNENPALGPPRLAHLTASQYVGLGHLTQTQYEEYFTFSVIRNPWSRVVSFYKFLGYTLFCSFDTFVKKYLHKEFKRQYWFLRPQIEYLVNEQGSMIVDRVLQMEQLEKQFPELCLDMGMRPEKLPHNNSSYKPSLNSATLRLGLRYPILLLGFNLNRKVGKDYRQLYTAKTRSIVEELYAVDVNRLGYKFEK